MSQIVEDWQREGRCFSRSRLGTTQYILPFQGRRNRLQLNWGGCDVVQFRKSPFNRLKQVQVFKVRQKILSGYGLPPLAIALRPGSGCDLFSL